MRKLVALFLVFCLMLTLTGCSLYFMEKKSEPVHREELTLPDFVGDKYEDIIADKENDENFEFIIEWEHNSEFEAGVVCKQAPKPGTTVPRSQKIILKVSLGEKVARVPNVYELSAELALEQLKQAGFVVLREDKSHETIPAGHVIETDPPAMTDLPYGSEVVVYVSLGMPFDE